MFVLREYLYVDQARVRSLLAQLDEGVTDLATSSESSSTVRKIGPSGFANAGWENVSGTTQTKSRSEALFQDLENALDAEGYLEDCSEQLTDADNWTPEWLEGNLPAGAIVRITAPGTMFDSRYLAQALAGFVAVSVGVANTTGEPLSNAAPATAGSGAKHNRQKDRAQKLVDAVDKHWHDPPLEAVIPADLKLLGAGADAANLRGIIQVGRGMFAPGLYLTLYPTESNRLAVHARLEEGREYLDSDADVLFSRYGVGNQEWTIVGTIGHHGDPHKAAMDQSAFLADGGVIRSGFPSFVNGFLQTLGQGGLLDLPQSPAFSVVPIAVYRATRRAFTAN